ncbi:MAG TPA: Wzz/FepE/Etk N-terminal domain-containing protein [Ktedonobacteraceae bacterium]|nr:Wzz/FepE/Etk N-terminal domain-containing protein [Ktedonobacteraceae bacterium]
MTFENYWAIFIKQWKRIAICFVLAGVGTFMVSKLMTPLYQATAIVQVEIRSQNNSADYTSLLASDQLVQTEAQLALSNAVLSAVVSHYPGLTVEQLASNTTSTPETSTQLFQISVLNADPEQAASLANEIAATLINQQAQVIQQEDNQSQQQMQEELKNTQQQINTVTGQLETLKGANGNPGKIAALQVQLSGLQQHYSQWQTALAQLELTDAQNGNFLRIAQPAQPSFKAARPNVLLNTGIGLGAGLFLGILLAVLYEQLDTRVRTPEQLSALLDWKVLGTVWRARTSQQEEIFNPQGHDANVESYRILRTNVGFSAVDTSLQTLVITSAMPGDGKSTVAANLAIFMAKAGKNTLLIDADLRRPTLHTKFQLPPERMGLSNAVLALSASPVSTLHPGMNGHIAPEHPFSIEPFIHAVGIPNLRVMPSGPLPPNPSELLESRAMKRLLELMLTCGAESVIFDVPPIRGLSDASILASKADGTLIVVDVTRAHKGHLKQVKAQLTQVGAHVVGCVVNKQRRSRQDTSYSYYYYQQNAEQRGESDQSGSAHQKPAVAAHASSHTKIGSR